MDMKDNSIVLFPNDKEGNDSRPDFRGEGLYEGVAFEASVWKNTSKAGRPYLKGQLQAPYNGGSGADYPKRDTVSDDVPF